jgi:1,4-dihydroxy-6-naphthoate synthase
MLVAPDPEPAVRRVAVRVGKRRRGTIVPVEKRRVAAYPDLFGVQIQSPFAEPPGQAPVVIAQAQHQFRPAPDPLRQVANGLFDAFRRQRRIHHIAEHHGEFRAALRDELFEAIDRALGLGDRQQLATRAARPGKPEMQIRHRQHALFGKPSRPPRIEHHRMVPHLDRHAGIRGFRVRRGKLPPETDACAGSTCHDPAIRSRRFMDTLKLTLGHSPDPDDAFMFYGLAKGHIATPGLEFEHILQDIQTLNERATRGELDISAVSIHAYAYVSQQYALLPSGASMGDGYGPMLVAKQKFSREEIARKRIAVPGTMTSAFLALQLWLGRPARDFDMVVVPFDEIFAAVKSGRADVGLIIHEGQLTFRNEGLEVCADLGVWWGEENDGLPLPLGGNVIHKRHAPELRQRISRVLTQSIQFSLDHRAEAVAHSLQYARDMGRDLADKFVGMYVNHWTLDYGPKGRESIRRFLGRGQAAGLIPQAPPLEFVSDAP